MVCPPAPASTLGVRNYNSSAPLIYVSSQHNEVSLYDLQDMLTRQVFRAAASRAPSTRQSSPAGVLGRDISDIKHAALPQRQVEGLCALLPLPSGGLICAGARWICWLHTLGCRPSSLICAHVEASTPLGC
jgi:hypothetical protein